MPRTLTLESIFVLLFPHRNSYHCDILLYWQHCAQAKIAVYVYMILQETKRTATVHGEATNLHNFKRNQPLNPMKQTTEMWDKVYISSPRHLIWIKL